MIYKKSLKFYESYIKSASNNKLFLCRIELLFRQYIIPNIKKEEISNKQKYKRKSFLLYCSYLFLAFLSIFYILKLKILKKRTAHYLIDINNSSEFYDFRSKEILSILSPKNSVNFMHINNTKYSLTTWHKKTNTIYFEAIYYVLKPLLKKQRFKYIKTSNNFANEILEMHQNYYNDSYYIHLLCKKIFKFLGIKQLICLDDSRYINELNLSAKELNIETIAYMHGRFNEFHLALFEYPFDKYFVWNKYFKEKILNTSSKYKEENIFIVGHTRLKEKLSKTNREKKILWLGESNIDYIEIMPFIKEILSKNIQIIFRGKPGENNILKEFIDENNIEFDKSNSFFDSLENNNIGLVIGTHSTALLEGWLLDVPSIALFSSYDYGSHIWEDNICELCKSNTELIKLIDFYFDKNIQLEKKINIQKNKIWNDNYIYNEKLIKKELGII